MAASRSIEEVYAEWEREVLEKGRRDGLIKGRRDGLIGAIEVLCSVLDIELSDDRRRTLASLDVTGLATLITELKTTRRWPTE